MNLFPLFRNKYFVYTLSLFFFIVSCTTKSVEISSNERNFDYSSFNLIKSNNIFQNLDLRNYVNVKTTTLERNQQILDQINLELNTDVSIPDLGLQLTDYSGEEIIEIALSNQWIDQVDVQLIDDFMIDLQTNNFDYAITNFENTVLSLDISNEKFENLNTMANTLESVNFQHPSIFVDDSLEKSGGWSCALATLALASATAGLASCVTVVACAAAVALHVGAMQNFGRECLSRLEPNRPEITN